MFPGVKPQPLRNPGSHSVLHAAALSKPHAVENLRDLYGYYVALMPASTSFGGGILFFTVVCLLCLFISVTR